MDDSGDVFNKIINFKKEHSTRIKNLNGDQINLRDLVTQMNLTQETKKMVVRQNIDPSLQL